MIYTNLNAKFSEDWLEEADSYTDTVPDQSLTVQDILRRFQSGTITQEELYREGDYDGDPDLDSDDHYFEDLTDLDAAKERTFQAIDKTLEKMKAEKSANLSHSEAVDDNGSL